MQQIESITGDLEIYFCEDLVDVSGLSNLEYIGGDLILRDAFTLKNLIGMEAIDTVMRTLFLHNNPVLDKLIFLS